MFNVPDGCSARDINGPPMPRCVRCGEPYSDYWDSLVKLCDDCYEAVASEDEDA